MKTIASLNLLESGNVEFESACLISDSKHQIDGVRRLIMLEAHWGNPVLQALLDSFSTADKGGMS